MSRGTLSAIALLVAAVVVLTFALVWSLARDHEPGAMTDRRNDYMGMMDAMGRMDSDAMLGRMQAILGQDGFQAMLDHMQAHRNGMAMPHASGIDGMMHQMMDGMMSQMPSDKNNRMPMGPR